MAVQYKLETFEGPLDLLLHLIDKDEIDIYDIPIAHITDQYMEYLAGMSQIELEATSEFLVMAATLLAIKSKMLLPKPPVLDMGIELEDGEDPREELVQKLIEYRKYKQIAEQLRDKELARSLIYSREPEDLTPFLPEVKENPLQGILPADLLLAFQRVLKRAVRSQTVAKIRRDEISVKDRILELVELLRTEQRVRFSKLFSDRASRDEIVVTFLALLELMKNKMVSCYQHRLFEDIVISFKEGESGVHGDVGQWTSEIDY